MKYLTKYIISFRDVLAYNIEKISNVNYISNNNKVLFKLI